MEIMCIFAIYKINFSICTLYKEYIQTKLNINNYDRSKA